MSFKLMRKNTADVSALIEQIEKDSKPKYGKDTRYWSPTKDESGNGTFIIRFLPPTAGFDKAIASVKLFEHSFQHPETNKHYIELSRTTIGEDDPVAEYNYQLYQTKREDLQAWVKKYSKRKVNFISNILVIKDTVNPANDGKVFLFKYGVTIHEKILEVIKGDKVIEKAGINPFCMDTGADFIVKLKQKGGWNNYDDSRFEESSVIHFKDGKPLTADKMEEIWNSQYDLNAEIAPEKFKSYEELKKRFLLVMGIQEEDEDSSPKKTKTKTVDKKAVSVEEDDIPFGKVDSDLSADSADAGESDDISKILAEIEM